MKNSFGLLVVLLLSSFSWAVEINLVPDRVSNTADYFNTWNVQGYISSYESSPAQRSAMVEENIFGKGKYQNWVELFPEFRSDLYFVLDDSWDSPRDSNLDYYGLLRLHEERFPSYSGKDGMTKLVKDIEGHGWKGVGLWICASQAKVLERTDDRSYWIERLKWSQAAGVDYWKVDWGESDRNLQWRKMLTELGREYAPDLIIEHAMTDDALEFCDVYRTYDVENVTSIPVTIDRVAKLLNHTKVNNGQGIICCEDEPYIAAGLGCSFGVMRHTFLGELPSGRQDFCFPPSGRDMKKRIDCELRVVRWHRIAEAFGTAVNENKVSSVMLEDKWVLAKDETWLHSRKAGDVMVEHAPAKVSRGLPLAEIAGGDVADDPYVLASLYPNGAIAIATIGRTLDREFVLKEKDISLEVPGLEKPIGIFGRYKSLTFILPDKIEKKGIMILAQDLAGDVAADITDKVVIRGNKMIVAGKDIEKIGLQAATSGDKSDPGMVISVRY